MAARFVHFPKELRYFREFGDLERHAPVGRRPCPGACGCDMHFLRLTDPGQGPADFQDTIGQLVVNTIVSADKRESPIPGQFAGSGLVQGVNGGEEIGHIRIAPRNVPEGRQIPHLVGVRSVEHARAGWGRGAEESGAPQQGQYL